MLGLLIFFTLLEVLKDDIFAAHTTTTLFVMHGVRPVAVSAVPVAFTLARSPFNHSTTHDGRRRQDQAAGLTTEEANYGRDSN